jgi:type I restriction enzyme S subunit
LVSSGALEGRLDATAYKSSFKFSSKKFKVEKLSSVVFINPTTNFDSLDSEDEISFVPMEAIDEYTGSIPVLHKKKVKDTKGFTRFKEGDLIWAKITPCMQNGKSAVVRNTLQGFACGSTEFFVIRPKSENLLIEYIHILLRDKRVLDNAQNFFGGSAGHQRVSIDFLKNLLIPVPDIETQKQIVDIFESAYQNKKAKEREAKDLLDSIDGYLLKELGIRLPDTTEQPKTFFVPFSKVQGNRFDPFYYKKEFSSLENIIVNSIYPSKALRDITIFIANGKTPPKDLYSDEPTEYPIIKAGSYTGDNINLQKVDYTKEKYYSLIVQKDDIFILAAAHQAEYVGKKIYLLEEIPQIKTSYVGELVCIRSNYAECNPYYLFSLLKTSLFIGLLNREKRGQTSHLYPEDVKHLQIPLPPLEIQNEIAEHIAGIRAEAKRLEQEAQEELEEAKQQVEKMILGE